MSLAYIIYVYCKLQTKFFFHLIHGPSTKHAGHGLRGKCWSLTYSIDRVDQSRSCLGPHLGSIRPAVPFYQACLGFFFGCPSPCDFWPSHLPISIAISGCGSITTMQPFFLPFWAHVHSVSFWSHYRSYLCLFFRIIFLFLTWCGHHILTIFLRHIFIGQESIQSLLFCFKLLFSGLQVDTIVWMCLSWSDN